MELNEVRYKIYECVKEEILGPGSEQTGVDKEEEIITDKPSKRYSTGILFTKENLPASNIIKEEIGEEEDTNNEEEDKREEYKKSLIKEEKKDYIRQENDQIDEELYEEMNNAHIIRKSAMGLTFFCNKNILELRVRLKGARYFPVKTSECMVSYQGDLLPLEDKAVSQFIYYEAGMLKIHERFEYSNILNWKSIGIFEGRNDFEDSVYKLFNQCSRKNGAYKRKEILSQNPIKLRFGENNQAVFKMENELLKVFSIKREYNDKYSITVMLINEAEGFDESHYVFQPEISICSEENNFLFLSADSLERHVNPELDLLYRNKKSYGIGHGVSVDYLDIDSLTGNGTIRTNYVPIYELPNTNFDVSPIHSFDILSMLNLSDLGDLNKGIIIKGLTEFVKNYEKWIKDVEHSSLNLDDSFKQAAKRNLENCNIAKERMLQGINTLIKNENVFIAFQLANKAMLIQRIQSNHKKEVVSKNKFQAYKTYEKREARWRAFQLAFLLMTISSIADKKNEFRDVVDLIWIPTGGGKTEAYLGVSAFTIFYRRLSREEKGYGTTIIMRYTLRLLAAQQFERACKLICACEYIRNEGTIDLGDEPISIGLWIGSDQTPNSLSEAKKVREELLKDKYAENKFQLLKCPWCGEPLTRLDENSSGEIGYKITRGRNSKFRFECPDSNCYFNEELPIQVVDECLYKEPPTLLFSTVDKFAMLTWKGEASSFFGHGSDNDCPELIIQDELHLISGPLGTLVGQFETAIDYLCSMKGIKPKIISSTATICEANEQVNNLYNRKTLQFPPPGIEIEDSFFTKEEDTSVKPGRLYVGLCGIGQTQTTTEIRLFASILQRISRFDVSVDVMDKYWTLVSYFNSIRELGKAATLIYDDVKDYMIRIANRTGNLKDTRKVYSARELTSRISSSEIIKTLSDLEKNYPNVGTVNILLATNMISVGVDVARMNVMTIIGQPKLTSEYIQASSRVGRSDPGIVFTLYDGRKSRDESHYEIFQSYHQAFYKYVEPTSITPFAEPALERMLHSVFIAMVRHSTALNGEQDAAYFDENDSSIIKVKEYIIDRISAFVIGDKHMVERMLDEIIDRWKNKTDIDDQPLQYTKGMNPLINRFYQKVEGTPGIETMTSMRNVDGEVRIKVLRREE